VIAFAMLAVRGPQESPVQRARAQGAVLPPGFDAWFSQATAVTPAARFRTAREAVRALGEVLGVPLGGALAASFPSSPSWPGVVFPPPAGVVDAHCGGGIGSSDEKACDATGLDATESTRSLGLASTIGFGVALAGLGTAAALSWTEPKQANPKAGAAPRWASAGVLAAGPTGAVLGATAAW
jgi:hypothetical protein